MLLRLYACYKQASDGDASGAQPSALDPKARAKHTAWAKLAGVDASDAMRRYVALAEQLDRDTVEMA